MRLSKAEPRVDRAARGARRQNPIAVRHPRRSARAGERSRFAAAPGTAKVRSYGVVSGWSAGRKTCRFMSLPKATHDARKRDRHGGRPERGIEDRIGTTWATERIADMATSGCGISMHASTSKVGCARTSSMNRAIGGSSSAGQPSVQRKPNATTGDHANHATAEQVRGNAKLVSHDAATQPVHLRQSVPD